MKIYLLLFSFITSCICQKAWCQDDNKSITKEDYYSFFNSLSLTDSTEKFFLVDKPDLEYIIDDTSSLLKENLGFTRLSIEKQLLFSRKFKWKKGDIINAIIIRNREFQHFFKKGIDTVWEMFHNKYGKEFWSFSVPLFNIDKTYCLVYISIHRGSLDGKGRVALYKKEKGKWVFIKSLLDWIS